MSASGIATRTRNAQRPGRSAASETAVLTAIGVGAGMVAALSVLHNPIPLPLSAPFVAHLSGLLAGYGVVVMIVLMARVPSLERGVGADRLARWHGWGGRIVLVLILVHAAAATLGWAEARNEDPVTAFVEVLGFPGLVAATIGTVLFLVVGVASMRAARRKLRYEVWHALHLATYVAIALSFMHELAGPDLAGLSIVQTGWSLLYTSAFALLLRYRLLDPLLRTARHRLRVERVVSEAPGVTSVIVRGRHVDELEAESGQFFRWRFLTTRTWWAAHPFSLSAPPHSEYLRLTVKEAGDGTRRIASLRPGTRVLAEGPYGAMTERRRTGKGVLLVAGGVGITPMRALFETLDVCGRELTLLYRASSEEELVFREELDEIATRRGAQLLYVVGRSSDPANAITGARLLAEIPGLARRDVFMCASPRFSEAMREALAHAGVPAARVHQEEFEF